MCWFRLGFEPGFVICCGCGLAVAWCGLAVVIGDRDGQLMGILPTVYLLIRGGKCGRSNTAADVRFPEIGICRDFRTEPWMRRGFVVVVVAVVAVGVATWWKIIGLLAVLGFSILRLETVTTLSVGVDVDGFAG